MVTRESLTGPELKAIRRNAGLSLAEMAELVGCYCHNVSY
jgi:DNA-binding transcriptional regulator YiaG